MNRETSQNPRNRPVLPARLYACLLLAAGCGSKEPAATYAPGLGEIMTLTQMRHAKLWQAGQEKNWPLAAYELDELEEGFADALEYHPTHKGSALPLREALTLSTSVPVEALRLAVESEDAGEFVQAFDQLTAGCNACHRAADFGFNVVTRPSGNPFANQDFTLPRDGQ